MMLIMNSRGINSITSKLHITLITADVGYVCNRVYMQKH